MAKRIQFTIYGGPEVMEYVDFIPLDPCLNEVQVENKAIGINYIDTYIRSGLYPVSYLPSGLGIEAAGIVKKIGLNVNKVKIGDRVVYAQSKYGAYSTIHNISEKKIVKLPVEISFEEAAAVFLKSLTVFYLFHQTYKIKLNEIFLFHAAAGGVGIIACQWAKFIGAKMIGTVSNNKKEKIAKKYGAWKIINYCKENVLKRILDLTNFNKVNVVYDSVGKNTWETSLDCLQTRGLMVSFGNSSGPVCGINLSILSKKGSLYVTRPSINEYITNEIVLNYVSNKIFKMISTGNIKINISKKQKFSLREVQLAHSELENRKTTGSLILIP